MQLKALDITGFKSFPDRIQLQFDQGITAVVGPNGSGKSNIADAVRWVLGEQSGKTLRSGKMEDVIFSGTQQRKPMGYATVSLVIDNSDHVLPIESDEVTINRKLYRTGESEYRINGTAVRLKDINELFMDTGLGRDGYSIIGQGRIAEIVSAKSAQRREIFEEAAGISKYRYRKEQAEKKLEQAQENLLRLKDILVELESRVGPLKEQAKKAQQYIELAERKRALEISSWMQSLDRSREKLRSQEDKLILAQNEHEALQRQLDELEKSIQDTYDAIAACNVEMEECRAQSTQLGEQVANLNSQTAVWSNDIQHNEETMARLRDNLRLHSASNEKLEEEIAQNRTAREEKAGRLAELEGSASKTQEELKALEEKKTENLLGQNEVSAQRAAIAHQVSSEKLRVATSSTLLEQLRLNAQSIEEQSRQNEEAAGEYARQLQNVRELLESIADQIDSQQNVKKGYLLKQKALSDRIASLNDEHGQLLSRQRGDLQKAKLIEDMERNMEGFGQSVKYVMSQHRSGNLSGIEGPVSSLISVAPEYATAVEIALGGAMQNIVVTTDAAAKYAIESLKRARAGRATFLPMSVIRGRVLEERGLQECEGFVALADELVSCEEKYRAIVQNLLGRIVVATDMDSALAIAKRYQHRFRVVTLDGQVIHPGGSMTGGSSGQSAGLLSRRGEIQKLRERAQGTQKKLDALAEEAKGAGEELSRMNAMIGQIDADLRTMSEDRIRYEGERTRIELAQKALIEQQELAKTKAAEIEEKLAQLRSQSGSSDETLKGLMAMEEELQTRLAGYREELSSLEEALQEKTGALSALQLERLSLQKDIDTIDQLCAQLESQKQSHIDQSGDLQGQIDSLKEKNEEIRCAILKGQEEIAALQEKMRESSDALETIAARKTGLEQQATGYRQQERSVHAKGENLARELALLEERKAAIQSGYDAIVAKLYDEYELTVTMAQELRQPIEDEAAANRELTVLRGKIKALGNINVAAIEEYREVNERYQFLNGQIADVENSKEQLHRMIHDLTREMKEIFLENFSAINEHFGRIFVELFSGGSAKLILTDPEDVLSSGIEIAVQPPGKIIKNLAALSGGEQAFVAIAIYFAILKVHPSPFCLLDEIEAALDDVNVVKYASYLRRLVDKTQFIAITHRRGTMEEADVLYGVTMQEEGVSKLLKLSVSEVESQMGIR